jgi:formiminotetrahydrofolate cyclodeaminase
MDARMQQETLETFLDHLASSAPTPGGGSVAALCGAISAALSSMVANLTLGREKFREVEPAIRHSLEHSEHLRARFTQLIAEDIAAYGTLSAAYKLPKATPEEQQTRSEQIQAALVAAAEVPLQMAEQARQALELCCTLAQMGNPNVISDVGVAALTAHTAIESASLNVLINLKTLKDRAAAETLAHRLDTAMQGAEPLKQAILADVLKKIGV